MYISSQATVNFIKISKNLLLNMMTRITKSATHLLKICALKQKTWIRD